LNVAKDFAKDTLNAAKPYAIAAKSYVPRPLRRATRKLWNSAVDVATDVVGE
jgi:hypothetical protein